MTVTRPFRFGVQTSGPADAHGWREHARQVEALGYSTLYMPDHFVGTALAPMVAVSVATAVTDTLRIGTLVLGNDYKHPTVVAKEAATLDVLSEGRLELGIGAGWMTADYTALDLAYASHRTRIERLGEAIEVVKRCWADGPFDFAGEHYTIREYDALPKPVQQPRPPILVGGGGKRVLTLAGKEADIVGINPNLGAGEVNADVAAQHAGRGHGTEGRVGTRRGSGRRPVRRDRAPDPLLHGGDHRRRGEASPKSSRRASASMPTRLSDPAACWSGRSTRSATRS